MTWKATVGVAVLVGLGGAWAIGRALHVLGLRHSGGHMLAEVVAIAALTLVALLLARAGRAGGVS